MSYATMQLSVFLCHGSEDKPAVRKLYQQLRDAGVAPWLDERDLLPGQAWDSAIRKAVRASDVILVCLSRRSVAKSGYLQKEIRFALDLAEEKPEGTIFLIPGKLEECEVPEQLQRWQSVDLFTEEGFGKLLRALQVRAEECANNKLANIRPAHSRGWVVSLKKIGQTGVLYPIISAVSLVISLALAMLSYHLFIQKPNELKQFTGRVSEAQTEKRIRSAKVILEGQGIPLIDHTDSDGIFSFQLQDTNVNLRIRVEAAGYQNFDRRINPAAIAAGEVQGIRLEPLPPIPSPALTPRPTEAVAPLRVKVKAGYRRDIYQTPNGTIMGKVEPGTVLLVAKVVTVNGVRWYLVNLENGDMYTNTHPVETPTSGWLAELAVEKK